MGVRWLRLGRCIMGGMIRLMWRGIMIMILMLREGMGRMGCEVVVVFW